MRPERGLAALALLAIAVPATAAAQGGDETEPTREQYTSQADPMCKLENGRSQKHFDRVEKLARKRKLRKAGRELIRGERIQRKLVAKLREIDRPPADVTRIGRWLRLYEHGVETSIRAGKQLKRKRLRRADRTLTEAEERFEKAGRKVRAFGFRHCA